LPLKIKMNMALLEDLNWRYATKKMNGNLVPQEKIDYILEAARMAPSSSGLQPYKLIVITDKKLLAKIQEIAFQQSQILDCSHLLVWAAWDHYSNEQVKKVFDITMEYRGLPTSNMDAYRENLMSMYTPKGEEWQANHAAKQSYISFGMAIAAAAELKVDATPMEGFDNDALDELLQLKGSGFKSTVILPLGYRDETNDWLYPMKKYRMAKEEFVQEVSLKDLETQAEPSLV
jgi:nitroreductase/dihydropteridine reductase